MLNKVMLIGNLGQDPTVRTLDAGVKVASFTIATSETYKDKEGEKQTKTEWHNIVAWRGLAEVIERFLKKGSQVYIEGKLTHRKYEDKDGVEKYMTEIVCNEMKMLGGRREGTESNVEPGSSNAAPGAVTPGEDLPF